MRKDSLGNRPAARSAIGQRLSDYPDVGLTRIAIVASAESVSRVPATNETRPAHDPCGATRLPGTATVSLPCSAVTVTPVGAEPSPV